MLIAIEVIMVATSETKFTEMNTVTGSVYHHFRLRQSYTEKYRRNFPHSRRTIPPTITPTQIAK